MAADAGSQRRWATVLAVVTGIAAAGRHRIVVDGLDHTSRFADRLAAALREAGHGCTRLTGDHPGTAPPGMVVADGPLWRDAAPAGGWDLVIWLRTTRYGADPADRARVDDAGIMVEMHDPDWPVIRYVAPELSDGEAWYLSETRAFFSVRAATWDEKFGDDLPAYVDAVARTGVPEGGVVIDLGCGTGRALPVLRAATGPAGTVIGIDVTAQMLRTARDSGRADGAALLLADARHLPLRGNCVDVVFAAGLLGHLPDPAAGLRELARVSRPGAHLALFHPTGRATLASRHGRQITPDDPQSEGPLRAQLAATGWTLDVYEDLPDRFYALATRRG